jgi:hypothetical protein
MSTVAMDTVPAQAGVNSSIDASSNDSRSVKAKRKRRNTEASQLTDALSSGDLADAELPSSKLRNWRSARGREQIAPTFYSGGFFFFFGFTRIDSGRECEAYIHTPTKTKYSKLSLNGSQF